MIIIKKNRKLALFTEGNISPEIIQRLKKKLPEILGNNAVFDDDNSNDGFFDGFSYCSSELGVDTVV